MPAFNYTPLSQFFGKQGSNAGGDGAAPEGTRIKLNSLHNVFACIVNYSEPRPTRGTDQVVSLFISDPSLTEEDAAPQAMANSSDGQHRSSFIEVMCFSRNKMHLPMVKANGDIIQLQYAQYKEYNNRPQLVAKLPNMCQFWLYHKSLEGPQVPYQTPQSGTFTVSEKDKEIIQELRAFYAEQQTNLLEKGDEICDLERGKFVEVSGKVVGADNAGSRHHVLYLWDGTDASFTHCKDWLEDDFVLAEESSVGEDEEMIAKRLPKVSAKDLEEGFPTIGSLLPVCLYKPVTDKDFSPELRRKGFRSVPKPLPSLPVVGSWVTLRNIRTIVVDGQLQALYLRSSMWKPFEDYQRINDRLRDRLAGNAVSSGATAMMKEMPLFAECKSVPLKSSKYSTIREVLAYEGPWTSNDDLLGHRDFKCLVRLVDFAPKDPAEFCRRMHNGSFSFVVKFHLQDHTAEVDALLLESEGSRFYHDCPEVDMREKPEYAKSLQQATNVLTPSRKDSVNLYHWFECCIRKLPIKGAEQQHKLAKYRIVNTKIADCVVDYFDDG